MDKRIFKQTTNLKLVFPSGEKKIFSYSDCTLRECINFFMEMQDKNFNTLEWIYNFLNDKNKISKNEFQLILIGYPIDQLFNTILTSRFKGFFNKKKSSTGENKKEKNFVSEDEIVSPYSSYVLSIADVLNCDVDRVFDFTPSQIDFYVEGKIWNNNERTPEGKLRNKMTGGLKTFNKNSIEEDRKKSERIKKLIESGKVKI